eukprot:4468186-Alexandrium_andersonii.AAC.1
MSASLVGSEMCIRDRMCHVRRDHAASQCCRVGFARGGLRLRMGWFAAPVSYTHLTLPTICSV